MRYELSIVVLSAAALLGGGCVSSTDIESLHGQVADVQRQVLQLQKYGSSKQEMEQLQASVSAEMQSLLKSEADMQVELAALSSQIAQLEGKLEDTVYSLNQLSQQIAATNQELKATRGSGRDLGTPPLAGEPTSAASSSGAAGTDSDPQTLYQTAYNDYLRGNYDLAILGFRQYLDRFPDTELSDNATYWIGECHFSQGNQQQAIDEFDNVLNRYPRSDKLASALLKKGYAYLEIGQRAQGIVQLQHVMREYPGTDEANLARQRLVNLGVDAR